MSKHTNEFWVLGHQVKYVQTEGDYGFLSIKSDPKIPGPPPHYHKDASELFYIIDGSMDVMVEGEWQTLNSGESFTVPKGKIHTFINNGDRQVYWITAFSPRGFEKFFLDFGVDINSDDAFSKSTSKEIVEKVILDAEKYDMIIKM